MFSFLSSTYGRLAVGVAALCLVVAGAIWAFNQSRTVQAVKSVNAQFTQEKIGFSGEDLTFADSTGKETKQTEPADSKDVEQTVTVESGTDEPRQLFVEQTGSWFPDITGRPTAQIRGLSGSDVRGITVVNQTPALFGLDLSAIMVGPGYRMPGGPVGTLAYTPIQIWAFRFGGAAHVGNGVSIEPAVSVEVRESLYLVGSVSPDLIDGRAQSFGTVSIAYRF